MFADYTTILEAHGSALRTTGKTGIRLLSVRERARKKDCNNGDNSLTYGQHGYEVVVLWYTSGPVLSVHHILAFADCLDATRGVSNRDSVLLARWFLWPVSGTKKVKNGHTWKRHKIAPGLRRFLLLETVIEKERKQLKAHQVPESSYIIFLYPGSLCDANTKNYCKQETEMNTGSKAAPVKQGKIKACLLLRKL